MLNQKQNLRIKYELFVKIKQYDERIFHMALLPHDGLTDEISPFLVGVPS